MTNRDRRREHTGTRARKSLHQRRIVELPDHVRHHALFFEPVHELPAHRGVLARQQQGLAVKALRKGLVGKFQRTRCVQADRAAAENDGLGIGLAVVRTLVEAHGGSVAGFSAGLGTGSRFVVELPLNEGTTVTRETPQATS
mgnify:CR=1 FL=1